MQFLAAISIEVRNRLVLCTLVNDADTYCDDRTEQRGEAQKVESSIFEIFGQTYR